MANGCATDVSNETAAISCEEGVMSRSEVELCMTEVADLSNKSVCSPHEWVVLKLLPLLATCTSRLKLCGKQSLRSEAYDNGEPSQVAFVNRSVCESRVSSRDHNTEGGGGGGPMSSGAACWMNSSIPKKKEACC